MDGCSVCLLLFIQPSTQTLGYCCQYLGWIVPPQLNFSGNAPTDTLKDVALRCGTGMGPYPGFRPLLNYLVPCLVPLELVATSQIIWCGL